MQFDFSDDQTQFLDSVDRILSHDFGYFRQRDQHGGFAPDTWKALCDAGLSYVFWGDGTTEFDADPALAAGVMQRFGYHLYASPAIPTFGAWMGGGAGASGRPWGDTALESRLRAGEQLLALAPPGPPLSQTTTDGDQDLRVSGLARLVPYGAEASFIALPGSAQAPGAGTVWADARDARVTERFRAHDGTPLAHIQFDQASCHRAPGGHAPLAPPLNAPACAVLAVHEITGVCERAFDESLAHVRTRRQFGKALADYQAIQHRLAEMHLALETLKAAAFAATVEARTTARTDDLHMARHMARKYARKLCEDAIQLHGAMGLTDEMMVGHCLQRALFIEKIHLQDH